MHTSKRVVEQAVNGSGRLAGAMASANAFFARECHRLRIEREIAREEIRKGTSNRDEMERFLRGNGIEQRRLNAGFHNSSLRRAAESMAQSSSRHDIGGVERRAGVGMATRASSGLSVPVENRETQTSATTTATKFVGHAAVFGKWTTIGDYFRESIAPGAFASALKTSDVRFLFNHNPDYVYGRSAANTLECWEDKTGLAFVCYLLPFDGPTYHLARLIDRRDVSGCSFSFTTKSDRWVFASKPGELDERTLLEFDTIYDIGCVVYPAYPQTDVQAVFEKIGDRAAGPADDDDEDFDQQRHDRLVDQARQRAARERDAALFKRLDDVTRRLQMTPGERERQRRTDEMYVEAQRIIDKCRVRA